MSYPKKRRSGSSLLVLPLLCGIALPAAGTELELRARVSGTQGWDSNAINLRDAEQGDAFTEVRPDLELRYQGERGHAAAGVAARQRWWWDLDELDAFDREVDYDVSYQLSRRLNAFSSGSYRFFENTEELEAEDRVILGGRPDFELGSWNGGFSYAPDPRSRLSVSASFVSREFDQDSLLATRVDSTSMTLGVSYDRRLSPRDTLSLSAFRTHNEFEGASFQADTDSDTDSLSLGYSRIWGRRWRTGLNFGVRHLEAEVTDTSIEPIFAGELPDTRPEDTSFSFVGSGVLERQGRRSAASLSYTRSTQPSSGFGTDVDTDVVSGRLAYRLSRDWSLDVAGSWQRSKSATKTLFDVPILFFDPFQFFDDCRDLGGVPAARNRTIPVCAFVSDAAIETESKVVQVGLRWRTTKRWSTFLRYSYRDQTSSGDRPVADFSKHTVLLGFRYRYDLDLL